MEYLALNLAGTNHRLVFIGLFYKDYGFVVPPSGFNNVYNKLGSVQIKKRFIENEKSRFLFRKTAMGRLYIIC